MRSAWLALLSLAVRFCDVSPERCAHEGKGGYAAINVDANVHTSFLTPLCTQYQQALARHPEVNITLTDHTYLVGGDDPVSLPSGTYKLWLHAQMLHYKETDIEFLWLDAPWIQSIQNYLEPIQLSPTLRGSFFPKTVQEDSNGDLITVPVKANYRLNYYRHDLFEKYGVKWPTSWDEFEALCETVVKGERALGKTFWCLDWNIDSQDTNHFSSYISEMASVDGGADLVLPGGVVNVDTPQLRKALVTMKRWINSDIMLPSAQIREDPHVGFDNGTFLMFQTWSDSIVDYEQKNKRWNWTTIKIGGSLGGEHGMDGSWHLGLNKAMRNKESGVAIVKEMIPYMYNITMHSNHLVPIWSGVMDNPTRRAEWCAKVPMYCESYDTYTDYHTKLSYRPSKGCGALYSECVQLLAHHLMKGYVHGDTDLETAVSDVEVGLKKLLGAVNLQDTSPASEEAKASWVALLVGASVVSVLFALMAMYVRFSLKKLRRVGFKVPVSAMLGLVTAISLAAVCSILLTTMDTKARSISEDLALRLRVAALSSVQSTLHSDDLSNPLLSETQRRRIALSLMMHWVSQLEAEQDALIFTLTYDHANEEVQVLMSTDNSVQKEHVFLPINAPPDGTKVSEVLHAFLQEFDWKLTQDLLFDPKKQHTLSADQEYFVNVKSVDTMPWHIVYIVPVSAVMGEATDSLNAARNYGILASLLAILIVTAFATLITRPLIGVSHHMEMARVMVFDEHYVAGSYLAETRALQEGFRAMAELLKQYKTFLPQYIFPAQDTDEESVQENPPVRESLGSFESNSVTSSVASLHESRKALAVSFPHNMKDSKGTLLICSVANPGALYKGATYTEFFESLEQLCSKANGVLHIFNAVSPETIVVSFGLTSTRATSICIDKATFVAFHIMKLPLIVRKTLLVSVTLHQGEIKSGNMGTDRVRGFGIIGKGAAEAKLVDQYACALAQTARASVVVATPVIIKACSSRIRTRALNVLEVSSTGLLLVSQMLQPLQVGEAEWMYQLEEMEKRTTATDLLHEIVFRLYETSTNAEDLEEIHAKIKAASTDDPVATAVMEQLKTVPFTHDVPPGTTLRYKARLTFQGRVMTEDEECAEQSLTTACSD